METQSLKLNEKAMTLIEVLVALVIMSILVMAFLPVFATASSWITGAGKRTIARDYATSIIELIRANSTDMLEPFKTVGVTEYVATDSLPLDDNFTFQLDPAKDALKVNVPDGMKDMKATLKITKHDVNYYTGTGVTPVINDNLYNVIVTITWKQGKFDKQFQMSTVIAAR